MFDVSFGEILIIAVVALVVIGPEKLPRVARTLGLLAGRMQRYVSTVKGDIERELKADELRRIQGDITSQVDAVQSQVNNEFRQAEHGAQQVIQELENAPDDRKSGS